MSDIEPKFKASVSTIWTEAIILEPGRDAEETVRVSIVNGIAKILIGGFEIYIPGNFEGNIYEVLDAYKRMIEEQSIAYAKLVDDSDEFSCSDPKLIGITDEALDQQIEELDQQIEEFMKNRGK